MKEPRLSQELSSKERTGVEVRSSNYRENSTEKIKLITYVSLTVKTGICSSDQEP